MLNVKFQTTRRQNKFFDFKNLNSYCITKKIDEITYQFELSAIITSVFFYFLFMTAAFRRRYFTTKLKNNRIEISRIRKKFMRNKRDHEIQNKSTS